MSIDHVEKCSACDSRFRTYASACPPEPCRKTKARACPGRRRADSGCALRPRRWSPARTRRPGGHSRRSRSRAAETIPHSSPLLTARIRILVSCKHCAHLSHIYVHYSQSITLLSGGCQGRGAMSGSAVRSGRRGKPQCRADGCAGLADLGAGFGRAATGRDVAVGSDRPTGRRRHRRAPDDRLSAAVHAVSVPARGQGRGRPLPVRPPRSPCSARRSTTTCAS